MSKKRYVDTKFWDDEYICELDPSEKLLFLYFLTNTLTNLCGIYEIAIKRIAFDTGFDSEMVKKILARFSEDGKIYYIEGYVYIKNFEKYQYNNNPKIVAAMEREKEAIPSHIMEKINNLSITYPYPIDSQSHLNLNRNLNRNLNLNSNAESEDQEILKYTPKDKELTDILLSKVRENYPFLKTKTESQLVSDYEEMNKLNRIDGYTYEQIEFIINFSQHDSFWKQNIRSVTKLRKQFEELIVKAKSKYTAKRKQIIGLN